MLILEIVVVLALFVLNGFFAMAELAILTSRRAHLERLAKEGRPGAHVALALADDPARMLAAVQIGIIIAQARRSQESSAARPSPNGSPKRCWPFLSWQTMASRFP